MDGVKVTYIETRFVTSDAAGFKDLVQRLTGRSPTATATGAAAVAPAAPHRPSACRAAVAAVPQGCSYNASASSSPSPAAAHEARVGEARLAPPCLDDTYGVGDFAGLLYGSASLNSQWGHGGCYGHYFPC